MCVCVCVCESELVSEINSVRESRPFLKEQTSWAVLVVCNELCNPDLLLQQCSSVGHQSGLVT